MALCESYSNAQEVLLDKATGVPPLKQIILTHLMATEAMQAGGTVVVDLDASAGLGRCCGPTLRHMDQHSRTEQNKASYRRESFE